MDKMDSQERYSSKYKLDKDFENTTDINNLSEMFDIGFEIYNNLNKTDESTNSSKVQLLIKRTINIFEDTTKLVSLVNMFSDNESFEEISTENIKYLLLPVLLGILTTKLCVLDSRVHIVDAAEIYFVDFLKRLKSYGLIEIEIPETQHDKDKKETTIVHQKSNAELILEMVTARNTKIQRYQDQKNLEKKLEILKKNLNNPNIDDETKRDYFVTLIKVFANQAIEELSSLASERSILEHMKKITQDSDSNNIVTQTIKSTSTKLEPIVITRDTMQKKVFGTGYPSLPILTVQEFYDQKIKSGEWPVKRNQIGSSSLQNIANSKVNENFEKCIKEEQQEQQIEKDDIDALVRMRAMDEYKDTHRRGWGNRANRS